MAHVLLPKSPLVRSSAEKRTAALLLTVMHWIRGTVRRPCSWHPEAAVLDFINMSGGGERGADGLVIDEERKHLAGEEGIFRADDIQRFALGKADLRASAAGEAANSSFPPIASTRRVPPAST